MGKLLNLYAPDSDMNICIRYDKICAIERGKLHITLYVFGIDRTFILNFKTLDEATAAYKQLIKDIQECI